MRAHGTQICHVSHRGIQIRYTCGDSEQDQGPLAAKSQYCAIGEFGITSRFYDFYLSYVNY